MKKPAVAKATPVSTAREVFPEVLEYARKKADEGDLWIATMSQMADYCEQVHG